MPYPLIGKEVDLRITSEVIEILHAGRRVATHPIGNGPGKTTTPEHMDPKHRFFCEWNEVRELDWAMSNGTYTHAFLQVLLTNQTRRDVSIRASNALRAICREYDKDRLEAACKLAMEVGAKETSNIRSILRNNLDRNLIQDQQLQEANFDHSNVRGSSSYH